MFYTPHILQKRVREPFQNDEFGRPIVSQNADTWAVICRCRCDHSNDEEIRLDDGSIVKSNYHIVCGNKDVAVYVNDYIRCVRDDGTIRGEGKVLKRNTLNYLPYAEIYL